ncbi:hypothetical protein [Halogeometricum limi]|uniref:Uncharacterized protein n=1 Tax=Halogeometricum limi TaxID=555875 RepID=A0A1I6GUC4_9EURY|nr:hypothetical protein [Halogeometricum limi]SFR45845.1 hypothetical protein SAMN04488124_1548 [Halogeometricum limi]
MSSGTERGRVTQNRRTFLKSVGALTPLLLGSGTVATPVGARESGDTTLEGSVSNAQVSSNDELLQQLLGTLTAGQGLWFQQDYFEPIQYVDWVPATRTHAFYKFGLGSVPAPWHGIGHRDTILDQPGGFSFSADDGLVTSHQWALVPYQDEQGTTHWILYVLLNANRVATEFQWEVIQLLSYEPQSDVFGIYNYTVQRQGVWQRYV